jgi:transposase
LSPLSESEHEGRASDDVVTKPFSLAFKNKMVQRLIGKDAVSARQLQQEVGVPQTTLSRWLEEARSLPRVSPPKKTKSWTVDEKVRILADASKLSGEELTAFLERNALRLAELEQWRLSLEEEGRASKATTKRIRNLERELARKEKALAEAAALLILKKKVESLLGDADDDTDEDSEK